MGVLIIKDQLKFGVILSYLSLLVGNGISIVYTPIMLRLLGQSEFGLYSLVTSFVAYLGLMDLGFSATYLRFYTQYKHSKDPKQTETVNGTFYAIFTIIAFLILVCGLFLTQYSNQIFGDKLSVNELITAKKLMFLLVVNTAIMFGTKIFEICIIANERFVFAKLTALLRNTLNPMIMLPLLFLGYKVYAMVMLSLILTIIFSLFNIGYCLRMLNFRMRLGRCDKELYKDIALISSFVFIGEVVDQVNWNVGKYILGRTQGTIAVAIYGIASQFAMYYRTFSSSISSVFVPRVNKIIATTNDNTELTDLMIKVGRVQFIILALFATGFVFAGKTFCCLWAGNDYANAYTVAVLLMLPTTIPLIQNMGISILIAKNKHRMRSIIYLGIAVVNVCITIPLSIDYSEVGCAVGTAISMVVGNCIIMNIYYFWVGLDMIRFWKSILRLSRGLVLPVCVGGIFMFFGWSAGNWSGLLFLIAGYTVLYCGAMYYWGLNEYEKSLFVSPLRKFIFRPRVV